MYFIYFELTFLFSFFCFCFFLFYIFFSFLFFLFYFFQDLKLNLKFEVEVLCKTLNLSLTRVAPSSYLASRRTPSMQDNPDFNARAHQRAANEERERKQRAELEEKRLAELGKYSSERAAREWSTVVDISIPPPSFKLVSLSSPRSPLSKTPKHVIF